MANIMEGLLTMIVAFKVEGFMEPHLSYLAARCAEKGMLPEAYQGTLNDIEMCTQLIAFLAILSVIELAKFGYKCWRDRLL